MSAFTSDLTHHASHLTHHSSLINGPCQDSDVHSNVPYEDAKPKRQDRSRTTARLLRIIIIELMVVDAMLREVVILFCHGVTPQYTTMQRASSDSTGVKYYYRSTQLHNLALGCGGELVPMPTHRLQKTKQPYTVYVFECSTMNYR